MAAAAPSPLASTVEKTNGAKLSRLLIDGGTTVLRTTFDRHHSPANLLADLNANYHILNNLLRRRVLHRPQWNLLFPPGGATPDSNTFDITLLFLLLTNICGLSPPASGWHTKPPPSDTSLEANLARIKFFRNKLYGHVTSTGIDTTTFCALWLEISAVLVALGLPQAEIDRLKAERCGEEEFIDVLFEWADSEEDIKTQLKDIHQSQTKTQQTVDEVHLTQLEDRKILQDSKRKLEEVHEVQTKTQKTVDEVHLTLLEDRKILQDSKRKMNEVHQVQTGAQQTVDGVRQSQIKTQQTVDEIRQFQIKTQQTVHEVRQSYTKTQQTVDEIRHIQHEFHKTLQETNSRVEEIQQTQEKVLRTQHEQFDSFRQDLKQTAEDLEGQREKHRENEILKKLAKIDTLKNVRYHADRYVERTRLSIFARVESWLDDRSSPNRVMVISGNAGMGKSVISAVMCEKMHDAGRLAGSHFCEHGRARHRNPRVMLQSLASQLCNFLPDYRKALVEKLSRNLGVEINDMELKDLFDVLFEEPLTSLKAPDVTFLMVIDGLDESEYQGRNELLDVIANYFQSLPLWIRFLVTTRPERNIAENLKSLHPLQLDPKVEENLEDIHLCFEKQISHLAQSEHRGIILKALVQKSEGVMLYAYYLADFIKKEVPLITLERLDSILPSGISSVYHSYFRRLETELCRKEVNVTEDHFLNFLSAVAAAREPLPLGFVSKLLLPGESTSLVQRKVNSAIACVSALLPVEDECIHFFHKSIKDWLIDKSNYGQYQFSVVEKEGHEVLSKLCVDELDEVKRKGVDCAQFMDSTKYALRHGVQHMLQLEDARVCSIEEVVTKFVLDVEVVYAKLCVNVTAASEDIVCVQKQVIIEELQSSLNTLLFLLRKHLGTLEKLPHTIFQTLRNEGGPELSSEALNLLETKYPKMAYMEYLHREDLQGRVQTKFQCSGMVTCFDVSPRLDYMVCECGDGTIQLWSLQTGKQLWKRDVSGYPEDGLPFFSESSCRSVVFHPRVDLLLPGILSSAYTFDGNLTPLFPSSKCLFCICSISADKTKMLTDWPNDDKLIIMWSLTDGSEISRIAWSDDILSFAWSRDGRMLAVSGCCGLIGLLDAMDGFRTLAQTTISDACEMIKFSPDCRRLYCLHCELFICSFICLDVNMENDRDCSLHIFPEQVSYCPWEFESCSETGFLLGDPLFLQFDEHTPHSVRRGLAFVLNKQSVLRVDHGSDIIQMLPLDELTKDSVGVPKRTTVLKLVFSLKGDTLFVVAETDDSPRTFTCMVWDISSCMFKPGNVTVSVSFNVVAVKEGVLLENSENTFELWNFELSECIRSWTDIGDVTQVILISEERVACEGSMEVIIVDTTREGIVSTIPIRGHFVACNSKCHVITFHNEVLQMQCEDKVLWKMFLPFIYLPFSDSRASFSPCEQYYVFVVNELSHLLVLDAVLGKALRILQLHTIEFWFPGFFHLKFVSDEEYVTCFHDKSRNCFLQLFNVNSDDPLSEIALEGYVFSFAACPRKRLIAIGFWDSKMNFEVLQVKLPGDKHSRKS